MLTLLLQGSVMIHARYALLTNLATGHVTGTIGMTPVITNARDVHYGADTGAMRVAPAK